MQSTPQNPELAKHGQYNLRHLDCLQLHFAFWVAAGVKGVPGSGGGLLLGTAVMPTLASSLAENGWKAGLLCWCCCVGGGGTTSTSSTRAGEKVGEIRRSGSPSSEPSLESGFVKAAVGMGVVSPSEEATSPLRVVFGADCSGSAGPKRRRLSSGVKRVRSAEDKAGCGGEAKKSSGLKACCASVEGEGDRPTKPGVGMAVKPGAGRVARATGVESVTVEEGGSEKGATPSAGEDTMTAKGSNGMVPGVLLGSILLMGSSSAGWVP